MKKHFKKIERLLAGVRPGRAGRSPGDTLADFMGFTEGSRREALNATIEAFTSHCPSGPVAALRVVEQLALRGKVHPRTLLYLAFMLGTMTGQQRERQVVCTEVLPAFLDGLGIKNARVAVTDDGLSINGNKMGGRERIEILDDSPDVGDKEVTWN